MENEDAWVISVEDDGVGFDVATYQGGLDVGGQDSVGIRNVLFRLDKVMGATVEFNSDINLGTTVTIIIPKREKESGAKK